MFDSIRLALIAAALLPLPVLAQDGATTTERLALSREAAGRMARRDLESILVPDGQFLTGNHIISNEGYLYTRPIETGYPGLCQHDQIIISYRTATPTRRPTRDDTLIPYAVRANAEYRVIRSRVKVPEDVDAPGETDGSCTSYTGKPDEGWFTADDARTAATGYIVLQSVAERVRAGTISFAKCDYAGGIAQCRDALLQAATDDNLWYISRCESAAPRDCFKISNYVEEFAVRTKGGDWGPADIDSIETEQSIIVT